MKKLMLALLVLGSLLSAVTYEDLREQCKCTMYARQLGLMSDQQKYFSIIDRFFSKAEQELNAIAFCKKVPDSDIAHRYITAICNLNVVMFRVYYAGGARNILLNAKMKLGAEMPRTATIIVM